MSGHVIQHCWRCHDQTPGKHQVAFRRAAAPTTARVAQCQPTIRPAKLACITVTSGGEAVPRQGFQQSPNPRRNARTLWHKNSLLRQPRGASGARKDPAIDATDRDRATDLWPPQVWRLSQLHSQPSFPVLEKRQRFGLWRPMRQAQTHSPICPRHPQRKPPRPRGSTQKDGDWWLAWQDMNGVGLFGHVSLAGRA